MSLLRLLTAGRSLVGLNDAETRYRMTSQKLLPRFGPGKNPFCAPDRPVAPPTDACGKTEHGSASSREPAAMAGARVAAPVNARGWSILSALRLRTAALRGGWTWKLTGLLCRPGSQPVRALNPRPAKLAVQGELSLDRIKVVRNDLSDTDLEVVRARPAAAPTQAASVPPAAEKAAPGSTAWGRLAARVRGAGRT